MNAEVQSQIAAKNFTYVSVSYVDAEGELKFDRFIVLSPSKPVARQAAEQIVPLRTGQQITPGNMHLRYNQPNGGATFSLYPRNYIDSAKAIAAEDPSSVYHVGVQTVTVKVAS